MFECEAKRRENREDEFVFCSWEKKKSSNRENMLLFSGKEKCDFRENWYYDFL